MSYRHFLAAGLLVAVAACTEDHVGTGPGSGSVTGNLRFVSGIHGSANVLVDGTPVLSSVALGGYAGAAITAGQHTVTVQKVGGGSDIPRLVTFANGTTTLIVGIDSGGQTRSYMEVDTNAVLPAGATKLRVTHFATGAPHISVWRTQPDYGTPIRMMFPFALAANSGYVQSTIGDWRVMISSEVNAAGDPPMPDTLANSGVIGIAGGASRTVVVVDGATAGSVQLVVVDP